MIRTVCLLAGVALAFLVSPLEASAQQSSIDADALAFGARASVSNVSLSPDGSGVVMVGAGPGRSTVAYHVDLASGTSSPILSSLGNPESLDWCDYATSSRLVCGFSGVYLTDAVLIPANRVISLDKTGKDIKELGQRASSYDVGYRQSSGSIIDWLPDDGNSVLMTRLFLPEGHKYAPTNVNRTKEGLGVARVNVASLAATTVEPPRRSVSQYMSDGQGNVRLLGIDEIQGEQMLSGRTKYLYRKAGSRDWQDLVDYQKDDFIPLAIDGSIDSLYALRKVAGRYVLIREPLDGSNREIAVASNSKVDIDNVVRAGPGQPIIGYTYADDVRHATYFNPTYRDLAASLGRALPKAPIIDFVDSSRDGNKVLLFAGSDRDPGRYYLFDRSSKSLGEVIAVRPGLANRTLASVTAINYPSSDGTIVPAYLTLPPGKETKNLPAIVLPHGGPSSRDEWGFDWLAQFLAARGYAVIQPEYRGSAGYGDEWLRKNGFKSWRTSMSDITSAAHYLAAKGIADPKRMAIVGWSYGGYAALLSSIIEPSLFKAVVAIAPVTDLGMLKEDSRAYTNSLIVSDEIGSGPHVAEASPLRRADAIQAPVLLIHGDMDFNVNVRHSKQMAAALKSAGKRVDYLEFKGLDHQLDDSDVRVLMLAKMGKLLDDTIGH